MMINFPDYLEKYAAGNTIYVLGGQGENLSEMTETERFNFISMREHYNTLNINRDLALFARKEAEGYTDITAFDCSGLVMHYLLNIAHVCTNDMTANDIYNACAYHPSRNELEPFDFVFYGKDAKNITHMGVYLGNGEVEECRGREYGVVITKLENRPWNYYGHFSGLDAFIPRYNHPALTITKPLTKNEDITELQKLLNRFNFKCGTVDGKFGKKTEKALKDFCRFYGD